MRKPSRSIYLSLTTSTLLGGIISGTALAGKDFSCTRQNNICVINDQNVVMGDQVGFFTERGELIATGKVTKMNGARRSVQLRQVMGPVQTKADSYAMLEGSSSIRQQNYALYKQPSAISIGSHVGLTTLGAGGDAHGYEASIEALRHRFLGRVDGFIRGSFYSFNGTAENTSIDREQGNFKATSIATDGGVSYTLFSQNDVALRTELGLGVAYTTAKINDSIDDAKSPDWGYNIHSGFAPHVRGLIAAGYNFNGWLIEAGVSPAMLAGKSATTIGAGILINMN